MKKREKQDVWESGLLWFYGFWGKWCSITQLLCYAIVEGQSYWWFLQKSVQHRTPKKRTQAYKWKTILIYKPLRKPLKAKDKAIKKAFL